MEQRSTHNNQVKKQKLQLTEVFSDDENAKVFDETKVTTKPRRSDRIKNKQNGQPQDSTPSPVEGEQRCVINCLLSEEEIEEDLKAMGLFPKPEQKLNRLLVLCQAAEHAERQLYSDVKIENLKLQYNKKWFCRGQAVYVEGNNFSKFSAIITSIRAESIIFTDIKDNLQHEINLEQLKKNEVTLTRRQI